MSTIIERPVFGAVSPPQTCPACDGSLPADAITTTLWRLVQNAVATWKERDHKLACPHCGERRRLTERRDI